jgi:hypothetical protein
MLIRKILSLEADKSNLTKEKIITFEAHLGFLFLRIEVVQR